MKFYTVEIKPKSGVLKISFDSWTSAVDWIGEVMQAAQENDENIGSSFVLSIKETEKS